MKLRTKISFAAFVVMLLTLCGCSTERNIAPSISGAPRVELSLQEPILGSVFDGRAVRKPKDSGMILQHDLSQLYGSSINWKDYFAETPKGKVSIRIRIVTLSATFGSRLISSSAYANSVAIAQGQASGKWGDVVASASSEQSVFAGSFSGEGWWNGSTWIDVEIQDCRSEKEVSFIIPIVAEHSESNMWGYASGNKAARVSWERASEQLTRLLDTIIRAIRDDKN